MHFLFFFFILSSPLLGCFKFFNGFFVLLVSLYFAYCINHTPTLSKIYNFRSNILELKEKSFFKFFLSFVVKQLYVGDICLYLFNRLNVFNFFFFSWSFICRLMLVLYLTFIVF